MARGELGVRQWSMEVQAWPVQAQVQQQQPVSCCWRSHPATEEVNMVTSAGMQADVIQKLFKTRIHNDSLTVCKRSYSGRSQAKLCDISRKTTTLE